MPIFPRVGASQLRLITIPVKNDLNSVEIILGGIAWRDFRGYLSCFHSSSTGLNEISMNNLRYRLKD